MGRNGLMYEAVCKIPQIQSRVAEILGVYRVLTYVPGMSQPAGKIAISIRKADDEGLFKAGPYGKLARRVGKKPVMFMNLITYTSAGADFTLICQFSLDKAV